MILSFVNRIISQQPDRVNYIDDCRSAIWTGNDGEDDSLEPRIFAACAIAGTSLLTIVARLLYTMPRRRRDKLRRRGIKRYENARPGRAADRYRNKPSF